MLRFTKDHEWIRIDGSSAQVGITAFAVEKLGPIIAFDFPEPGKTYTRGSEIGAVDSVKAASAIYAPAAGTVTEVNAALTARPALANDDPMGEGWLCALTLSDPAEIAGLMDEAAYAAWTQSL